jgi:hypothetical protein
MSGHDMRKSALRRYVVFRVKAIEFLDIVTIRQGLKFGTLIPPNPVGRTPADFSESLRTVQLSWFAIFIDKSKDGMDVIALWKELFPLHKAQIEETWNRIEPTWPILRQFRDRAGFHADKAAKFFNARSEIEKQLKAVTVAAKEFEKLFRMLLKAESAELPELEKALDSLLDELEESDKPRKYYRQEFKRHFMFPNTQNGAGSVE